MSPAAALDECRDIAVELERREKSRRGGTRDEVRGRVATRVRVAPGTIENLVRGRLKRLESWVHGRLRRAWIAELKGEIARHETELAGVLRRPDHSAAGEVAEIESGLAALRLALVRLEAPATDRAGASGWSDAA